MMRDPESIHTPASGPPQGPRPDPAIYAAMGEANIFRMAADFYQRLGQSAIAQLFPEDLEAASRRQALFLIGILGGPPLYQQAFGHPRMRARHLPFRIDEAARQEWLRCFRETLARPEAYRFPPEHLPGFLQWLEEFSAWMVNSR